MVRTDRGDRRTGLVVSIAIYPAEARSMPFNLGTFSTVTLDNVVDGAALMRRVDRKYLVPAAIACSFLEALDSTHSVLEIAGRRSTTYRSTYFDTEGLAATRAHVQKRRLRWKVRQRWYVEDDLCRIEVKTKNGRGETVKEVGPSSVSGYGRLGPGELAFVESALAGAHSDLAVTDLHPSAEVTYSRATFADLAAGNRVTLDWGLVASLEAGEAWLDQEFVLIETKGSAIPAIADRVLTRLGARPQSFSKYAATTSLLHPDIADNDVRRHSGVSIHVRSTEGSS